MASAVTIFMPLRRISLLTLSKRSSSTNCPPKESTTLCPFSICSVAEVNSPIESCMFLLSLRKIFDTKRISTAIIGPMTKRTNVNSQLV